MELSTVDALLIFFSAFTRLRLSVFSSSLTPKLLPDTAGAPRGLAMKVFGVEGSKIFQSPDQKTQDWTFNNYPLLELRTPQVTNEIADSLERNWNDGRFFLVRSL